MLENIRNISGNFLNAFAQVLISIAVSRMFSPEYYGEFVYNLAIAYMLSVLFNFGYNIFALVFFSKKYFNILRLLITYSYLSVAIIVLACLLLGYDTLGIASIYVFLIMLKEMFNNSLAVDRSTVRKLYFNLSDLTFLSISLLAMYFLDVEQMDIRLLFGIFILAKLLSLVYLARDRSMRVLVPLMPAAGIRYFRVFTRVVRFNSLNVLFTTLYTQGYFIVIGMFLSFTEVSLVKYLSLVQANLNIITGSVVQLKHHFFREVSTKLAALNSLFRTLISIQLTGAALSFALIYFFSLFKVLFDIDITDYVFILVVLLSFTLTPVKQALGIFLTSKNLFMQRTNSIIISVVLAFPVLFLLGHSLYFVAAYFLLIDLISIFLFTKSLASWRS